MKTFNLKNLTPNPANPRVLRDDQYKKLLASIKRDPEFLSKRPVVHADNVILGGNMRYRALLEATKDAEFRERIGTKKAGEVPASWVLDASEFTEEQRRRFVIVDNAPDGMSGDWDWDVLANEWEDLDLNALGLEVPGFDAEIIEPPLLPDGDKSPFVEMTFILHNEQHEEIESAIKRAKSEGGGKSTVNENSNGNALAWICGKYNRG